MRTIDPPYLGNPAVAERQAALHVAREVLTFIEAGAEDLLIVADWITTGRADAAVALVEARHRAYLESARDRGDGLSPDAARWTPEQDV